LDDYYLINVPSKWEGRISEVIDALDNSGIVDWIENNETIKLSPLETSPTEIVRNPAPNYGLNDPGVEQLWGFQAMNVDKLYEYLKSTNAKPNRKAIIAILDTGVDSKHEDIKANYKTLKSKDDNDPQGHGTHCAGIAASVSNNGIGVASFSHDNSFVQVSSIKVLNSFGMGTQQSIINGIIQAADLGADVISMSLGGPSSDSKQRAYEKAVNYANKKGAIVVVAAGNENRNATRIAPACAKGVITVSAIDNELNRAVFSNWVTDLDMGIAAPGVGIYSTKPNDTYAVHSGTSMATPYVAGLVGLMKSFNPNITTKEVYKILDTTGSDTKNTDLTGHLIQPVQAVKAAVSSMK
jgi:thermitase